ncbi:MAG TPA: hypothetical protein PKI49_02125, partial [Pseudomonadota bacterium]|nr:hypothetical protein [Pseudomonadota bacterium]
VAGYCVESGKALAAAWGLCVVFFLDGHGSAPWFFSSENGKANAAPADVAAAWAASALTVVRDKANRSARRALPAGLADTSFRRTAGPKYAALRRFVHSGWV